MVCPAATPTFWLTVRSQARSIIAESAILIAIDFEWDFSVFVAAALAVNVLIPCNHGTEKIR